MGFERVGSGLAGLLARWVGDDDRARTAILRRIWRRAVGDQVARRTEVESFRDGVLGIRVLDRRWSETLEEMEAELRREVNEEMGGAWVEEIRWLGR